MALLFSPASQSLDPTFGLVLFGALDDDVPYLEYLHRKPCFVGGGNSLCNFKGGVLLLSLLSIKYSHFSNPPPLYTSSPI